MSRTNPAPNAIERADVVYAPDPYGARMVHGLQGAIARALNGARFIGPRAAEWNGWTQQLQRFQGHAGLGAARIYAPRASAMQDQNTGQTVASQIFTDRASRGY